MLTRSAVAHFRASRWRGAWLAVFYTVVGAFLLSNAASLSAAESKAPLKLLRYGPVGKERPGLLDANGVIRDLSKVIPDITPAQLSPESMAKLAAIDPTTLPRVADGQRLGVPIKGIRKIPAVGLNYADHIAEAARAAANLTGAAPPPLPVPGNKDPVLFQKAVTALVGANDDVVRPRNAKALDYEVELVIVIGKTARNVQEKDAGQYIAGYAVGNDVTEREWQTKRNGQWTKGKSSDTFAPLGPYIVAANGVDQDNLGIWLKVNGQERQRANTSDMLAKSHFLVAYISQFMSLEPGDAIYTGTPSGVGAAMKPATFLQPGDVMTLGIDGLGEQRQKVVAYEDSPFATAEDQINALEQRRLVALGTGDAAALGEILTDDYVHVHAIAKVENKQEFITGIQAKPRRTERGPLTVRVYGDSAVVTGEMTNYFANPDKPDSVSKYFATQVVHRQQGKWLLASMQVTPLAR